MRTGLKTILAALLALCAAAACVCCSGDGETTKQEQTGTSSETAAADEIDYADCCIVRPAEASSRFVTGLSGFRREIYSRTGQFLLIREDIPGEDDVHATYEILYGPTSLPESAEALAKMDGPGFVVMRIGRRIVINGTNDNLVIKGGLHFLDSVLPQYGSGVPGDFLYVSPSDEGEYELGSLTINGIPLKDFRIVIPERGSYEIPQRALVSFFNRYAGITLPVSSTAAEPSEHEIVIGIGNRAPGKKYGTFETEIYWKDGRLYLGAGSPSAASQVIDTFLKKYVDGGIRTDIQLSEGETVYSSQKPDWGEAPAILSDQDKILRSCRKIQELLEYDHSNGRYYSYKGSGYESSIAAARANNNRLTNCIIVANWVLKDAGFYSSGNLNTTYDSSYGYVMPTDDCRRGIKEHFEIIRGGKTLAQLKAEGNLYPGDVIIYSGVDHMNIFYYDGLAMDGGRGSTREKAVGSIFNYFLGPERYNTYTASWIFRAKDALPGD